MSLVRRTEHGVEVILEDIGGVSDVYTHCGFLKNEVFEVYKSRIAFGRAAPLKPPFNTAAQKLTLTLAEARRLADCLGALSLRTQLLEVINHG